MSEPTTCTLPRGADVAELHAWDTASLDIAKCDRTEFVVALYAEYETAGVRPETWPDAVRAIMERTVAAWLAEHKDRAVRAISYGAPSKDKRQVAVVILHHCARSGA